MTDSQGSPLGGAQARTPGPAADGWSNWSRVPLVSPRMVLIAMAALIVGFSAYYGFLALFFHIELRFFGLPSPSFFFRVPAGFEAYYGAYSDLPFIAHLAGGAVATLCGALQFIGRFRRAMPSLHRMVGLVFIVSSLISIAFLFVMLPDFHTPLAGAGLGVAALVWGFAALLGLYYARHSNFPAHRAAMIVSFTFLMTAFSLRILYTLYTKLGFSYGLNLSYEAWYSATVWMLLVFHLSVARFLIWFLVWPPRPRSPAHPREGARNTGEPAGSSHASSFR